MTDQRGADGSGDVYTWGFNEKGQLGLGHRFNQDQPQVCATYVMYSVWTMACLMRGVAWCSW
jgi:alpha-tubulin suppressor-like RCC1 family protein